MLTVFFVPVRRGSYFGVYTTAQTIGPVIGPVLGGIIAETLSWRWVFWVLLIFAGALFVVTFMFLPETLRSLVGNGSGYASPTPIQWVKRQISGQTAPSPASSWKRFMSLPNFLEPLKYFLEADLAAVLLYLALHYAVYTAVLISMSSMFPDLYGLNQLQVGLCYLVQGFGCILGSFSAGRLLDHDYRVFARKRGLDAETKKGAKIPLDFPIYWARLRTTWIQSGVIQIVTIIYGWMLWIHAHLVVPLILQFFSKCEIIDRIWDFNVFTHAYSGFFFDWYFQWHSNFTGWSISRQRRIYFCIQQFGEMYPWVGRGSLCQENSSRILLEHIITIEQS